MYMLQHSTYWNNYISLWCIQICYHICTYNKNNMYYIGFSDGSAVRNPPAKQETQVQSAGWEDPLEKEMTTYSSILAWKIPWIEEPGTLQSMGSQRAKQDWVTVQTCTWYNNYTKYHCTLYIAYYITVYIIHEYIYISKYVIFLHLLCF